MASVWYQTYSYGCLPTSGNMGPASYPHPAACPPTRLLRSGRVSWPPEWKDRCPPAMQDLVMACLTIDPTARPFMTEVKLRAEGLLARLEATGSLA